MPNVKDMTPLKRKFKLRNQLSQAGKLNRELENFADQAGLSRKELYSINLAIEELFANVVNYGYQDAEAHWIEVFIAIAGDQVEIRMIDDGRRFNPMMKEAPDTICPVEKRRVGGLGIHLCRHLMDEMAYERQGMRNIVTMKKKIER